MPDMKCSWLTAPMATLIVGAVSLMLTGLVALVYTPLRSGVDELRRDVSTMKADPHPKPETKVKLDALSEQINDMSRRIERLDERLANLHIYLMQVVPPSKAPPPGRAP